MFYKSSKPKIWRPIQEKPIWWNDEIVEARKTCFKARRKMQRLRKKGTVTDVEIGAYKIARRIVHNAIRRSKVECGYKLYKEVSSDICNMQSSGCFRLQEQCLSVDAFVPEYSLKDKSVSIVMTQDNYVLSKTQFNEQSECLSLGKAPSSDDISKIAEQTIGETSLKSLVRVYNEYAHHGNFPSFQIFIFLPKSNSSMDEPSSYWPLRINMPSKLFQSLISSQTKMIAENVGRLSNRQFEIRKKKSITDVMALVMLKVKETNKKNKNHKTLDTLITIDIQNVHNSSSWKEIINAPNELELISAHRMLIIEDQLSDRMLMHATEDRFQREDAAGILQALVLAGLDNGSFQQHE